MKINRPFQQGLCLNCGTPLSATSAAHDRSPRKGSIMICLECSHVMEWDGARLIELSDEALNAIAGAPELVKTVETTGAFRRWRKARGL